MVKYMKLLNVFLFVGLCMAWSFFCALDGVAAAWEGQASGQELEGVKLSASLTRVVDGETLTFTSVGKGLRVKKVVFVKAKVYVAELFFTNPEKFVKSSAEALSSLEASKGVAVKITFLRDVDSGAFVSAFRDGWKANQLSEQDPFLKIFLEKVKELGDQKKSSDLVVAAILAGKNEKVFLNSSSGPNFEMDAKPEDRKKLFSLWLGKTSDSGLEDLQKELLSGK